MKILIVDDNENIRFIVKEIIKGMNFQDLEVFEASEGGEGIALIFKKRGEINLVITDYDMFPGENGFEVAKFVKENYPDTPVILMTANCINEDEKTKNLGIRKIISKPFNLEGFRNDIKEVIGNI